VDGQGLKVENNATLTNLDGLSSLTSVNGYLDVSGNATLTNLDGLSNLTYVHGSLYVSNNAVLTNLDGLSNLTSVYIGNLAVASNDLLINLDGLSNLTSVDGFLFVSSNNLLTNLDGLNNITSVSSNLSVINNNALNVFCGLYPLLSSTGLGGSYTVSDNLLNPTQQQIIDDGPCLTTAIVADNELFPKAFNLHQNYPNPFNPTTTINFDLPEQSQVNLTVFDLQGREIMQLQDEPKPPGNHKVQWNGMGQQGNQVTTGVYFCRLTARSYSHTIKMLYLP